MRLRNAFKNSVFEASKWVSTKTLLLKHYYRRQGSFQTQELAILIPIRCLETNLASRWEGVRLPRASGKSPDFPGSSRTSPEVFGDFPGSSLTVELNSNPEVPRKFPKPPRKFPKLPRKFPDFPGGQPLSLGSLTPSPDSQELSLSCDPFLGAAKESPKLRECQMPL